MRENSPSPPPTADFGAPSGLEPLLPDPNAGGLDAERPAVPSTASSQPTSKSRRSTASLQSLHLGLANLGSKLPQSKPLFRGFEEPSFPRIAILTILCLFTYPAFYLLTLVAKDRSLFIVRAIVGVWCWVAGLAFGSVLLKIGAQHLEAASKFALAGYRDFLRLSFKQPGPPWFTRVTEVTE